METIRKIHNEVCFFDVEFVPDVELGRRLLEADGVDCSEITDDGVASLMQVQFSDDRGIMKSIMYRIVSIAGLVRKVTSEGVKLSLLSLPTDDNFDEAEMIRRFLTYVGANKPQLVGYASHTFDLTALYQRAIVCSVNVEKFCQRPAKPWDDAPDYFGRGNDYNIDLVSVIGNFGSTTPRLEQIALACKIPAKIGCSGAEVSDYWFADKRREIVDYNECDALTTYLLWLRVVLCNGLLSPTQHLGELQLFIDLLNEKKKDKPHLAEFQKQYAAMNFVEVTLNEGDKVLLKNIEGQPDGVRVVEEVAVVEEVKIIEEHLVSDAVEKTEASKQVAEFSAPIGASVKRTLLGDDDIEF